MTNLDESPAGAAWLPWRCPDCQAEHSDPAYITETFSDDSP
jgi:hypothetical protein